MKPGDTVTTLAGDRLTVLEIDGDALRIGKAGSAGGLWCGYGYVGRARPSVQGDLFASRPEMRNYTQSD